MNHYTLNSTQMKIIESLLKIEGYSYSQPKKLAQQITSLSKSYHSRTQLSQIWSHPGNRAAYLSYFLPLNTLRAQALQKEMQALKFLNGIEHWIDFGSGLGAMDWALAEALHTQVKEPLFIETAKEAASLHQKIQKQEFGKNWGKWIPKFKEPQPKPKSLTSFSYSLNELRELPEWALNSEALAILEPSTGEDGRKLMQLRQTLIAKGFSIWAPCTHQGPCPLLEKSKKDWCHQRVFVNLPEPLKKLEDHLPMKNRTVTFSYLLARKTVAPSHLADTARVIGDTLKEKGKTRQAVCRGEKREFLSWLKKEKRTQEIPRGSLVQLPDDIEQKSDEIRPQSEVAVLRS